MTITVTLRLDVPVRPMDAKELMIFFFLFFNNNIEWEHRTGTMCSFSKGTLETLHIMNYLYIIKFDMTEYCIYGTIVNDNFISKRCWKENGS